MSTPVVDQFEECIETHDAGFRIFRTSDNRHVALQPGGTCDTVFGYGDLVGCRRIIETRIREFQAQMERSQARGLCVGMTLDTYMRIFTFKPKRIV